MDDDNISFMVTTVTAWIEAANQTILKRLKPGVFPTSGFRVLSSDDDYLVVMLVEDGTKFRITVTEEP